MLPQLTMHYTAIRKQFDEIYTIFMYSVQPGPLPDLNVLTDVCVKSPADPLLHGKTWGMITNPYVKVRIPPILSCTTTIPN